MRALLLDESGALKLDNDYPDPAPGPDEALIEVTMAGVCNTDLELIKGYMGYRGVIGHEFVGIVKSAPHDKLVGKRVVGEINIPCGQCPACLIGNKNHCPTRKVLGIFNRDGAFADCLILPVENLHIVPDNVPDIAAVFTEPLAAAFEISRQVLIEPESKIAVLGDGKLGLLISQVISLTRCDLTAVGRHKEKLDILDRAGIKTILDSKLKKERMFNIVIEATGSPDGLATAMELVKPCGTIVLKTTLARPPEFDMNRLVIDEITLVGSRCGPFDKALNALEQRDVDTENLVSALFGLDDGIKAMKAASNRDKLKILVDMTKNVS